MPVPHPSLVQLRDKVDSFSRRVTEAHGEQMACGPGCADCCAVDLHVFPVEAEAVALALDALPEATLQALAKRKARGDHCVMLLDNRCAVYQQRPLICRSQGLPLQVAENERTVCPLNFTGDGALESLPPDDVLNLNTLNTLLSVLHRVHIKQTGRSDRRIPLTELVAD